jgi:hypothetical protein
MKNVAKVVSTLLAVFLCSTTFAQPIPPGAGNGGTNSYPSTFTPPPYVPGLKLAIPPVSGTNLPINLLEADTAGKYDIYCATDLVSSPWNDVLQGTNGQTSFSWFPLQIGNGFFRAARTDTPITNAANMTVSFPSLLVNTNLITASVDGGPAAAMAVLVNDTNFDGARWIPFSSVPYVLLGTNDRIYDVWFGFRGSDGTNYWSRVSLTLDTTAPSIIITNPVGNVISQPMIQLQGYCLEALSSITYDLTNAGGLIVNQPAFVTAQYSDTNAWKFTTNWFQRFDIPLTNGLNIITLHATDLAGNTTTTNLSFTLDYSSKTNPPAVQLYWPQNGVQISGTNFLLYGHLDDATARVNAQIVDADNNTNVADGLVGRDGVFWIQNLPLNPGTNILTLTVTDVVGNVTVTNVNLVQSDVTLTINSVLAGQTAVSGTISASGYTVWVNGTNATQPGDGTWSANIIPVTSGNGIVEATAIPNSDNGGNGSGRDFSGNPMSALSKNASTLVAAKSGIHAASYDYHLHREYPSSSAIGDWTVNWADGAISTEVNETWNWSVGYPYLYGHYQWPATKWPQPISYFGTKIYFDGSWHTNAYSGPPPLRFEYTKNLTETHNPFNTDYGALGETIKMNEQVDVLFSTGGNPGSTEKHLYCISPYTPNYSFWVGNYEFWTGDSVPPQQITIATFGQLDVSGNAYALLPDNTTVDVTPQVKNLDWYAFNLLTTEYTLTHTTECTAPGNTNNARTTIGIGEMVDFGGMPDGTTWSVSGQGNVYPTNGSGTVFTASKSPGSVTVTATIGNVAIPTTLNVIAPSSITVISEVDCPPWEENPDGSQMGAQNAYIDAIGPTNVSFYNVDFREKPTPPMTLTWPNGTNSIISFNEATNAWGMSCESFTIQDEITMPLISTNHLFNGANFVDFSFSFSWPDQYRNEAGEWTDFYTLTVKIEFRGSDKKCRITYLGVPGGWQGPY